MKTYEILAFRPISAVSQVHVSILERGAEVPELAVWHQAHEAELLAPGAHHRTELLGEMRLPDP